MFGVFSYLGGIYIRIKVAFLSHLDWNLYLFRLSWMRALQKEGFDVYAVVPEGKYTGRMRKAGLKVITYTIERKSLSPFSAALTIFALYRVFRREKFHMLHTFTAKPNIFGSIAAWLAGIPVVLSCVEGLGYIYIVDNLKTKILKIFLSLLNMVAFKISAKVIFFNKDDLAELSGLFDVRKAVLLNGTGVDVDYFSCESVNMDHVERLKVELGVSEGTKIVTLIARLLWSKGIREFVYAAEELHKMCEDVIFLIVGGYYDGSPDSISRDFVKHYEDKRFIKFLGSRDDIREILYITDVYVLPSYREGLPRTVLEAMSMCKPVIASDVPGCRDAVDDGVTGFLIPPKDAIALASALGKLLRNEELRYEMGIRGREKVIQEFSDKVIVEKVVRLDKALLEDIAF